jgi:hypothetical protein
MRKGSRFALYAMATLLCMAGVAMSVIADVLDGRVPKDPRLGATIGIDATGTPQPAGLSLDQTLNNVSGSSKLTAGTRIFWVTRYTTCGHEKVREEPPEQSFVGKTVSEFASYYPDCKLEIEDGLIRMVRTVDQYCPDHYYIKSDASGNIYVYRNMEGLDKLTMVMKLNFTTEAVPQDYRPLLEEGMAFGSVEEIEGLIEDAES